MQRQINKPPISYASGALWIGVGFLSAVKLNAGGEIYVGEILAVTYCALLLATKRFLKEDIYFLLAGILFACVQLTSDIINGTPLQTSLKGVGAPILFCITVVAGTIGTAKAPDRALLFLLGVGVQQVLLTYVSPTPYQEYQPWKWGYGPAALLILLSSLSLLRVQPSTHIISTLILAIVSFSNDARSLGGLPLIGVASYLWFNWRRIHSPRTNISRILGLSTVSRIMLFIPAAAFIANAALSTIFSMQEILGLLDPESAAKYSKQASSEVGLLFAGRSEWLVSTKAFLDAPIFGHGSWAQDRHGYLQEYANLQTLYGLKEEPVLDEAQYLIPAHSYLFGALVWGGVTGGLFWIYILRRSLTAYLETVQILPPLLHAGQFMLMWDIFFSPFGAQARWGSSIILAALFAFHRYGRSLARNEHFE